MSTFYEQGRYVCKVTQQGMTKASTGNPQLVLKVMVLERYAGPNSFESVPAQYERSIYRTITDGSMKFFRKDLDALGFKGNSLRQLDPKNSDFINLAGVEVDCLCNHEADYKDSSVQREKWSIAWPESEVVSSPVEGAELAASDYRALDALFGKGTKTAPRQAAPKPQPQPQAAEIGISDDDVPF